MLLYLISNRLVYLFIHRNKRVFSNTCLCTLKTLDELHKTSIVPFLLNLGLSLVLYTVLSKSLWRASNLTQVTMILSLLLLVHTQSHSTCCNYYHMLSGRKLFEALEVYQTQISICHQSNYQPQPKRCQNYFSSPLSPFLNRHIKSEKRLTASIKRPLYK